MSTAGAPAPDPRLAQLVGLVLDSLHSLYSRRA
jgi:hypothetical protein